MPGVANPANAAGWRPGRLSHTPWRRRRSSLARCDELTGEAAGVLDQYMQRIDDLDRIIQPVAARTQVQPALHQPGTAAHVCCCFEALIAAYLRVAVNTVKRMDRSGQGPGCHESCSRQWSRKANADAVPSQILRVYATLHHDIRFRGCAARGLCVCLHNLTQLVLCD